MRWRAGAKLVALTVVAAAGCTPPCYDDGWFQNAECPPQDTDSVGGTGTTGPETTGTETAATEGVDGGVMTADGESGSSSGGPVLCPSLDEQLSFGTHTFQLVVDQSDPMNLMFDGASRWSAIEDALVDAGDGVVTERQSTTRFGLTSYQGLQAGCPSLATVSPQLDAADEIAALFAVEMPTGVNPLGDAIEEVTDDLAADPWDGDKSLVLILGDEPSTCQLPAPANALDLAITREAAQVAVEAAFTAGFPTVVVSVGDDVDPGFLQVLANVGAGQQPGDPDAAFFVAQDDQELVTALAQVLTITRACSFTLGQALPMELAPGCTVEVNGAPVGYDDPNGWSRPDEQTLELQGTACEAIQQGDASVEMVCNCDDV